MKLPELPNNNTVRGYLSYTCGGEEHTMNFRLPDGSMGSDVLFVGTYLANQLKNLLAATDSFTRVRWSQKGSNLSFPLTFNAIAGTGSPVSAEPRDKALFLSVVGRSMAGYRCRLTIFSTSISDSLGFRVPAGGLYAAATSTNPILVAKDGNPVIWNSYENIGSNSYWERELRK